MRPAGQVVEALRAAVPESRGEEPGREDLDAAFHRLARSFDQEDGGFGSAPKFPTPHQLLFLLRYWKRTGRAEALAMVGLTLQRMHRGGIFDQLGFGFHRYSTDRRWLLPHFEKMLYDQALIALAALECFQATGEGRYATLARETFSYVLRDLAAPAGACYSAEDADSEGIEGRFYLWTEAELDSVLGPELGALARRAWGTAPGGNFEPEAAGTPPGANLLHLAADWPELAAREGLPEPELRSRLEQARQKLFAAREARVRPARDRKVLTDWNGLTIAALARGAQVLGEPPLEQAARAAAEFLLDRMRDDRGRLLHSWWEDQAGVQGMLDDYAFLAWGLFELYEATFEVRWLEEALALVRRMNEHFWDREGDGYFFTADDAETVLVRQKELYDGATPSGNSVAAWVLLRLARVTGDPELEQRAAAIGRAFSASIRQAPHAFTHYLCALDFQLGPSCEVVLAGRRGEPGLEALREALRREYLPNKVVLLRAEDEPGLERLTPFAAGCAALAGKAAAYVCRDRRCELPVTEPRRMLELLGAAAPAGGS